MKKTHFILILALLSAFPPLSTDMYLPAMPLLQERWNLSLTVLNLTLVLFFVSYCIFLLVYGPLSDRFGRRPPLMAGIAVYIVSSLICALSNQVTGLIIFRILQAAGAASASVIALAIAKDLFRGHERGKVLAHIGVIMALAPMLAPSIGSMVMAWFSWRMIFIIQAIMGIIAWASVYKMPETLPEASGKGLFQTLGIYLKIIKNRRFSGLAILMSLVVLPHFAFLGGSADIYITGLGMSEQSFGYFFAANAAAIMAGSMTCSRILPRVDSRHLLTMSFFGILAGGVFMAFRLLPGPWGLVIPMGLISFSFGLSRPPSNNLVLEQVDEYAGSASSLLVFIYFMIGAFSMWLISFDWSDKIQVIGILGVISSCIILGIWLLIPKTALK